MLPGPAVVPLRILKEEISTAKQVSQDSEFKPEWAPQVRQTTTLLETVHNITFIQEHYEKNVQIYLNSGPRVRMEKKKNGRNIKMIMISIMFKLSDSSVMQSIFYQSCPF